MPLLRKGGVVNRIGVSVRTREGKFGTIMNTWWRDKAKTIQEAVDSKEPNALYAGQRKLQSIFLSRRKRPNKLRDKKGRLILTQPDRLERCTFPNC